MACYALSMPAPRTLPPLVREAVADLKARLRARFGRTLSEMRVFGSMARGQATDDSDVDVLVVLAHRPSGSTARPAGTL